MRRFLVIICLGLLASASSGWERDFADNPSAEEDRNRQTTCCPTHVRMCSIERKYRSSIPPDQNRSDSNWSMLPDGSILILLPVS